MFSTYVSNKRSQITGSFVNFGCLIGSFLNSANLICHVEVRISRCVSEGPFDFEITRVDCIIYASHFFLNFKAPFFKHWIVV